MKRGDVVKVAASGDYGKPRPAIVVQSDRVDDTESVILCLCTGSPAPAERRRITLRPNAENGLQQETQIMAEKLLTLPRKKVGGIIGHLDHAVMARLDGLLMTILGIGG